MTHNLITAVPDFKAFARASDEEAKALAADSNSEVFGKDGLSFGDVLDAINPLNHIPVVSDIYSNLTGEKRPPVRALPAAPCSVARLGLPSVS